MVSCRVISQILTRRVVPVMLVLLCFSFSGVNRAEVVTFSPKERRILQSLSLERLPQEVGNVSNQYVDNPAAATLGKYLFLDTGLSRNGKVSCAKCHQERRAFTDGLPKAFGLGLTGRNSPSLIGVAYQDWFYWDGRRDSLWSQALVPFEAEHEMGIDRLTVVKKVLSHPVYSALYGKVFGQSPIRDIAALPAVASPHGGDQAQVNWGKLSGTQKSQINRVYANVGKALAAYQTTLDYEPGPFDIFLSSLLSGEEPVGPSLSVDAQKGLKLFIDDNKTRCLQCHNGPRFSNGGFHNIGTGVFSGKDIDLGRSLGLQAVVLDEFNCLGEYSDADPKDCHELRFLQKDPHNMNYGAFKTPSLRNISKTAPYYHDGRFRSLAEVMQYYVKPPELPYGKTHELTPLQLDEREIAQLVAFLRAL